MGSSSYSKNKMVGKSLLLMAVLVSGRPQEKSINMKNNPSEERKADPSLVINCIAENSKEGLEEVRKCLKCFAESGDPLSVEGLTRARSCTEEFLPRANKECEDPLADLEPENEGLAEKAVQCFVGVTQLMAAEECLARETSDDLVETFTDGVSCLKESHQNTTFKIHKLFEKQIKQDFEKFKKSIDSKKAEIPKEDPLLEQLMSLTSKRNCEIASNTTEEVKACMECFESSQPTESYQPSKQEFLQSLATCSSEHLSPHFDECTAMMENLAKDPEKNSLEMGKQIFTCNSRVVTRNLVEQCSRDMTEVTPENLLAVTECGHYTEFKWFKDNIDFPELRKNAVRENILGEEETDSDKIVANKI